MITKEQEYIAYCRNNGLRIDENQKDDVVLERITILRAKDIVKKLCPTDCSGAKYFHDNSEGIYQQNGLFYWLAQSENIFIVNRLHRHNERR